MPTASGTAILLNNASGRTVTIHRLDTAAAIGTAAAGLAAETLRRLASQLPVVPVVFATGASQLATLRTLTSMPDIPWKRVVGFHLDEYIGLGATHPASFRRYLRNELVSRVPVGAFHYIDADARPQDVCDKYAAILSEFPPRLCLLGVGENGHLAFNDPGEADFNDPKRVKIVNLDDDCRRQQVHEGWFASLAEVPARAITLTIPALMAIPEIIASVPGERKAEAVRKMLHGPISPAVPSAILRLHPNAHLFLDDGSAPGARGIKQYNAQS